MTALDANDVARARGPEGLREVWDAAPVQGQYAKSTRFQLVPFNDHSWDTAALSRQRAHSPSRLIRDLGSAQVGKIILDIRFGYARRFGVGVQGAANSSRPCRVLLL